MSLRVKVTLVFLFFIFMDVGVYMSDLAQSRIAELEEEVAHYRTEYDHLQSEHGAMQAGYRDTLVNIVENLYSKESYRNVGGVNEELAQDNELLYQAIINATTPFNRLLQSIDHYFDNRKKYLDNIPSIWPVNYSELNRITSPFGVRISPWDGSLLWHKGIDISGPTNAEILSAANGVVKECWIYNNVYGRMIVINHQNGYETLYGHMNKTFVKEGQPVQRGQVIGLMGNTGQSLGLHLHYEVHKDGVLVNPIDYLTSNNLLVMGK